MTHRWTKKTVFIPLLLATAALVFGGIVMVLWNGIVPSVFNLAPLSYWQAVGLFVLSRLLVSPFRFGPRGGTFGLPPHVRDTWMNMSEEERSKFKDEWKARCEHRASRKQ